MIGFLLKKYLYDAWDNFFFIILLNFGFLIFLALTFGLLPRYILPRLPGTTGIVLFVVCVYWLFVYLCAAASVLKNISDYRRPAIAGFFANIKGAFVPAGVLFTAAALVFFVLRCTVPIYFAMGNLIGFAAAVFSCWTCFFILASIQFYPAVYYRLGKRPLVTLKKCALIFLDNTGFCVFTAAFNLLIFVLILPIPGCHLLFLDEALRLRLFKYDWLEAQAAGQGGGAGESGRKRKKIPWKELLAGENEKTGTRSLMSFIFPWKD